VSSLRRRAAEHRALGRVAARPGAEARTEGSVDDSPLWQHVRRLPARQRQVIALVYVEDRAVDEVAAVLGISESSVKTHLQRGWATLAAALAPERATERTDDDQEEEDR
jgi:RNA polymerase sigma factor (sigma-70 family)